MTAVLIAGLSFSATSVLAQAGFSISQNGNVGACFGAACSSGGSGGWTTSNPYGLPAGSILGILSNLLFWLLSIFAILGIIGFVLSGIWYLLAAGEESMMEKGKDGMKYSIIGLIVGLSGFIIMQAVSIFLGGASKTF